MTSFRSTLLISFGALVVGGILLWLVSLARRDASIVDPAWGMGFVLTAWLAVWWNWPASSRGLLLSMRGRSFTAIETSNRTRLSGQQVRVPTLVMWRLNNLW